jgi:four helix bundle protein
VKYSELLVWQKAMDLVSSTYRLAASFPDGEKFGLIGQLQRAAVSMPANIAEGHGRKSTKAYLHHLSIANGSLMELETLIRIAARLGYVGPNEETVVLAQTE